LQYNQCFKDKGDNSARQTQKTKRKIYDRNEASGTLRHKATLLLSRATQIRLYSVASTFRILPSKQAINEAHGDLIFLSNSCFKCNSIGTFQVAERIKKLLTTNEIPLKVPLKDLVIA
jgi:hypothetical protein